MIQGPMFYGHFSFSKSGYVSANPINISKRDIFPKHLQCMIVIFFVPSAL